MIWHRVRSQRNVIALTVPVLASAFGRPATGQDRVFLDETWAVTANGQSVQVNPDGSFFIPNVSAADNFGPGGPGTPPDFLSDDFIRAVATRTVNGVTEYVFSEPFQIRPSRTHLVHDLTFTTTPPPMPVSITLSAATNVIGIGQEIQLTTTGILADGSEADLTPATSWTSYRTSNPAIVTVNADGRVVGTARGTASITATNGGATAVKRLIAAESTFATTIEGFVVFEDGTPAADVTVTLQNFGGSDQTGLDGAFSISAVAPAGTTSLTVTAEAMAGDERLIGNSGPLRPVAGGITDAGIIVIRCEPHWVKDLFCFPGLGEESTVYSMTTWNDGSGEALFVGGLFTIAGCDRAVNIAKWDGKSWSALGSGFAGVVNALAVLDDGTGPALYVGGGGLAKWDGRSWSPLAAMNGRVNALAVFDDGSGPALYAGGSFTTAGSVAVNNIAKWDGTSWSSVGTGLDSAVRALAVFNDGNGLGLYTGGVFTSAGGVSTNFIAKWDGLTWSSQGTGMNHPVRTLTSFDDGTGPALYAGGDFTTAGGITARRVAKWDGTSWFALGGGIPGSDYVATLIVFDEGTGPALYAGGRFCSAGGIVARSIAKWNGSEWFSLGSGIGDCDKEVYALGVFDEGTGPALFAGGAFLSAGGVATNSIAKWDGTSWSALGTGMNAGVLALAVFDDGMRPVLSAGGYFTTAGGLSANSIAKWDGSSWSALGTGMNLPVHTLTVFDDGTGSALYAGGEFTTAGGIAANRIAKWDGVSWSPVGMGMSGCTGVTCAPAVHNLTVFDDGTGPRLYAGGKFITAGGVAANGIAKWDGSNWSPLGSGMNRDVDALAVFDDGTGSALYAGGDFTTAGGVAANYIAKWDGLSWSPLGTGTSVLVYSLTTFDDGTGLALYAAGPFTSAGGVLALHIAKWDGEFWSSLGTGMNSWVRALRVFDDGTGSALYAGGAFTTAGGVAANYIAKWDGLSWSPLGTGTSFWVYALTTFDDGTGPALYAGGQFTTAGGNVSAYMGKWHRPAQCPP